MEKPVTLSMSVGVYSSSSSFTISCSGSSVLRTENGVGLWFGNNSGSSSTGRSEVLAVKLFSLEDKMLSSCASALISSFLLIIALNREDALGISFMADEVSRESKSSIFSFVTAV